jgi:hypothetical protein
VKELIGDVSENRGAPGRDAAFGHQDQKAGQEFAEVIGGGELRTVWEEVFREVAGVAAGGRRKSDSGVAQAGMVRTERGLGFQAWLTAALAIGIAMLATGANRRGTGHGGGGLRLGGFRVEDFHVWGLCGHGFPIFLAGGVGTPRPFRMVIKTKGLQNGQFVFV